MSITKLTEEYVRSHPSIKDALIKGLINYSALSREICKKAGSERFDAVLMACRRYYHKARLEKSHEETIISLVKGAKLRVRNKIIAAIIEKPYTMEQVYLFQKSVKKKRGDFNIIEGEEAITVITNSEHKGAILDSFKSKVIKISDGVAQLSMVFDKRIEDTSGVVSYIYNLLAENNINILEEMSCWTDLMMLIEQKDMDKAVRLLSF